MAGESGTKDDNGNRAEVVGTDEWQGQTGQSWATHWRRTDRSFGMLIEQLLRISREFRFSRVLDIGCGAGELSLALARGRPGVTVTGVDISPALIETARERGANLANLTFETADAAVWSPPPDAAPDLLVSRHGVMFFVDPPAAFSHLADIAAPDANLLFSCFRDRRENPFFTDVTRLLPGLGGAADPSAPGPFAFADPARIETILSGGQWREIEVRPFDFAMIVGAGEDPIADAVDYFLHIGPAARTAAGLPGNERDVFIRRLAAMLEGNVYEGIVSLRAATWIVTARRA